MDKHSIAEQVFLWIEHHPYLRLALKNGYVNYSSLARSIQDELSIKNFDAVVVAIRRFYEKVKPRPHILQGVLDILAQSQLEIRTGINVYIVKELGEIKADYYHLIKGSRHQIIITDQRLDIPYEKVTEGVVEVRIRSPEAIESEPGVILEIYQKLFERGVNIVETYSAYTDTVIIVEKSCLMAALEALNSLSVQ
jgi:hypothetical protein